MAVVIIREEEIEKWFRFITHQFAVIRRDLQEIKRTMATQADLDAALASVETEVQQLGKDVLQAISDLEAKIGAGATDLQPEVDRLTALGTQLAGIDTAAVAAETPASAAAQSKRQAATSPVSTTKPNIPRPN